MRDERSLPPFQILAEAAGLLSTEEMDGLIAQFTPVMQDGRLGDGRSRAEVRRSKAAFVRPDAHAWLHERLWAAAQEINALYFNVDISTVGTVQIARYDGGEAGFYDWHMDFGDKAAHRKISISVQLSGPEDYEGGDLEFMYQGQAHTAQKTRGAIIAFPSFTMHRVAPVTRGSRWSLVAWITGPRWR